MQCWLLVQTYRLVELAGRGKAAHARARVLFFFFLGDFRARQSGASANRLSFFNTLPQRPSLSPGANTMTRVEITTSLGPFTVELYTAHAPKTCHNFVELARRGYYDGTIVRFVVVVCLMR